MTHHVLRHILGERIVVGPLLPLQRRLLRGDAFDAIDVRCAELLIFGAQFQPFLELVDKIQARVIYLFGNKRVAVFARVDIESGDMDKAFGIEFVRHLNALIRAVHVDVDRLVDLAVEVDISGAVNHHNAFLVVDIVRVLHVRHRFVVDSEQFLRQFAFHSNHSFLEQQIADLLVGESKDLLTQNLIAKPLAHRRILFAAA
mmetsp:Transcript_12998/g.20651  ORF Transcript_12998/g.20651 Transcript_12998/m.20651 type:complete len:201 (+) Transcript_12998:554-1156(+)